MLSCAGQFLLAVVAGVVANHLPGGRTQSSPQPAKIAIGGGGEPQVFKDVSFSARAGVPRVTIRAEVVPADTPATGRAGGRHKTRGV